jgi:hypothetical protein
MTNSTVYGSVSANRAGLVTICGSTIYSSLWVANTTGPVLVGDAGDDGSPACAANTLYSNATVSGNAGAELGANLIYGSVSFNNNGGTGSTEASPEVEANTIYGSLACGGNSSVSNDGRANTVYGGKGGQCATA